MNENRDTWTEDDWEWVWFCMSARICPGCAEPLPPNTIDKDGNVEITCRKCGMQIGYSSGFFS